MPARLDLREHLGPAERQAALSLLDAVTAFDGVRPLSERATMQLRYGAEGSIRSVLAFAGEELVGYAQLDLTDQVSGPTAELAVRPSARRRGVGRLLVAALEGSTAAGRLRLWAHGQIHAEAAAALAAALGFIPERVLLQLRRSLLAPLPAPARREDVRIRTFVVGTDEQAWLELNARAFAHHPEQGKWTLHDLQVREAQPWFDPAGFFLAERHGKLIGFHWTKVHAEAAADADRHEPIGEVYVIGVDPSAHHQGLGLTLTVIGLQHLRALGLSQVMLYVDETNRSALRLYESLGFTRWDSDVCYRKVSQAPAPAES